MSTFGNTVSGQITYFSDTFQRVEPVPWVIQQGSFGVANGTLQGSAASEAYGFAYLGTNWTDYSVEAQIQFSSDNALGAGIGGRVNPVSGAHYGAWVYPENSVTAARAVRLVKFTGWGIWSGNAMATATIPAVGTNTHQLKMTMSGNLISISFDGATVITAVDNNADGVAPFTSGGISMDMYANAGAPYSFSIANVDVTAKPLVTISPASASRPFGGTNPAVSVAVTGLLGTDSIQAAATIGVDGLTPSGVYPITALVSDPNNVLANYTVVTNQGTITITPSSIGLLYRDEFNRSNDPAPVSPWTVQQGSFELTNQVLRATSPPDTYGYAYIPAPRWSNYWVSAQVRCSSVDGLGGGIGGRLNPVNGAHYGAWIYPANSLGGANILRLIKFRDWNTWSGIALAQVNIPPPGTNAHVLSVGFQTNRIIVNLDGNNVVDAVDNGFDSSAPLATGGITADMYTDAQNPHVFYWDNVVVQLSRPVLTVIAADVTRIYGGTNPVLTATLSGVTNGDTIQATATCSAGANAAVGPYPIIPALIDPANQAPNYEVHFVSGNLSIVPAPLTIAVNDANRLYGQLNPAFTATMTGFVNGEDQNVMGGTLGFFTSANRSSTIGTYPIIGSGLSSSNYILNYATGTLSINPASLAVTPDNQSRLYGAANPTLTGQIVGLQNSDPITADYSTVATATSPFGTYAITATLNDPANRLSNYSITTNTGALTIEPAPLLVQVNNASRAYGQANPQFSAVLTGLVNGETATALNGPMNFSTAANTNSPAGTYAITAAGLSSTNYSITYSNGTLTVSQSLLSVTADHQSRLYGGANPALTGQITGIQNGDSISAIYATTADTNSPVGTYIISPALLDPAGKLSNYSITTNAGILSVLPAPLVVQVNDASRGYGQTNPAFSAVLTGFVNDEQSNVLSGTLGFFTTADTNSAVGTYSVFASGLTATNYSLNYSNGMLTVTPSVLTVTPDHKSRLYGAVNPEPTGVIAGLQNGDAISGLYSTLADTNSPVGTYKIAAELSDPAGKLGNYSVTTNSGVLTVSAAPLVVLVNDSSRAYGQTNPAFIVRYSGFVNGETSTVLSGSLLFSTLATTNSPIGQYEVAASGLLSTNYDLSYTNGMMTITPFALTVTPSNQARLYGSPNPALTGQVVGIQNGDAISATYTTVADTNSPVATYPIVAELIDPRGSLTNYSVTTNTGMLTIQPAPLTIRANDSSRLYGQANPTFRVNYDGFVNGESETVLSGSLALATSADTNSTVGTYAIVPSGFGTLNYAITYMSGTLTISPSPLTINIDNQTRLYGALNPSFTGHITGLQNGDQVVGTYVTAADTNTAVGNYPITAKLEDPGTKLGNYAITTNAGTLTITAAASTLALTSSNPGLSGQKNVTFTATVSPVAPAIINPNGNLMLFVNGAFTGHAATLTNGVATFTLSMSSGTNLIVAAYLGDGNFGPSINSISQVVTNSPIVISAPIALGINNNGDGTITVTFSGTPGVQYPMQASGSVEATATWTNLGNGVAEDDGKWTLTDSISKAPARFYRAIMP